jgi:hypothetical protein
MHFKYYFPICLCLLTREVCPCDKSKLEMLDNSDRQWQETRSTLNKSVDDWRKDFRAPDLSGIGLHTITIYILTRSPSLWGAACSETQHLECDMFCRGGRFMGLISWVRPFLFLLWSPQCTHVGDDSVAIFIKCQSTRKPLIQQLGYVGFKESTPVKLS